MELKCGDFLVGGEAGGLSKLTFCEVDFGGNLFCKCFLTFEVDNKVCK